jgi:hypothetical protein
MNDHFKREHGNEFHIAFNVRVGELCVDISKHQREVAIYLLHLFLNNDGDDFKIPCIQCYRDMILQTEDMARLMKELIEPVKVKK